MLIIDTVEDSVPLCYPDAIASGRSTRLSLLKRHVLKQFNVHHLHSTGGEHVEVLMEAIDTLASS